MSLSKVTKSIPECQVTYADSVRMEARKRLTEDARERNLPILMRVGFASEEFGPSEDKIREAIRAGQLPSYKIGEVTQVSTSRLIDWIVSRMEVAL